MMRIGAGEEVHTWLRESEEQTERHPEGPLRCHSEQGQDAEEDGDDFKSIREKTHPKQNPAFSGCAYAQCADSARRARYLQQLRRGGVPFPAFKVPPESGAPPRGAELDAD
ncbi:hypothetical protein EYF80_052652 [Liparis tanakae]|uniref:Uncharacterized protein n=1 Tax=Liparis tanakae TaxID=230148 RepID=A0A4Z2FA05_9TELE|nr:hypothetical protein EYF80_052652 [Liparis tanakae]